ncbi:MAG TPA: hypothetical protein VFG77_06680 [Nitrososphaeraceae archaeon]|nr:hypothetical protein [Nitrososphaeraceae archaeon]
MNLDNNNKKVDYKNDILLLEEAEEIARGRKCTRDYALYIMFSQAMTSGDKRKAEACMNVLEREVIKSLGDPVFKESEEGKKRKRKRK